MSFLSCIIRCAALGWLAVHVGACPRESSLRLSDPIATLPIAVAPLVTFDRMLDFPARECVPGDIDDCDDDRYGKSMDVSYLYTNATGDVVATKWLAADVRSQPFQTFRAKDNQAYQPGPLVVTKSKDKKIAFRDVATGQTSPSEIDNGYGLGWVLLPTQGAFLRWTQRDINSISFALFPFGEMQFRWTLPLNWAALDNEPIGRSNFLVVRAIELHKRSSLIGIDTRNGHIAWTVDTGKAAAEYEGSIVQTDDDTTFVAILKTDEHNLGAARLEFRSAATGKPTRPPLLLTNAFGMLNSDSRISLSIGIIGDELWARQHAADHGLDHFFGQPTCVLNYEVWNLKTGKTRHRDVADLPLSNITAEGADNAEWRDALLNCHDQMVMAPIRNGIVALIPQTMTTARLVRFSRPP